MPTLQESNYHFKIVQITFFFQLIQEVWFGFLIETAAISAVGKRQKAKTQEEAFAICVFANSEEKLE